jgi:hypothetical protein
MGQLCRDPLPTLAIANGVNRMGVFAGLVAGVTYSTYASFVANALTPVSGRLIELSSFRRTVSGRYQEVVSLNGVVFTMLGSLVVFALVWWMMRVTLEHWQSEGLADPFLSKSAFPRALPGKPLELSSSVSCHEIASVPGNAVTQ